MVRRPRCEPELRWRKSSLSLANGNCVEVADPRQGGIAVRDSMDPGGPVLRFGPDEWHAFLFKIGAVGRKK